MDFVRVAFVAGQVYRLLILDQRAGAREHLQQAAEDLVQHPLNILIGRRRSFDEARTSNAALLEAIQHKAVHADVQVGR